MYKIIKNIKAVAFDLDGTIYCGEKLIDGAADLIGFLENQKIMIFYFTNNSTKTRHEIYRKLVRLGLNLTIDQVYTSAYASAIFLKENRMNNVFCIGTAGLIEELVENGVRVNSDEKTAECILVGLDTSFDYSKIVKALYMLQNGCKLIVCNLDKNYPSANNELMPGCGAMVGAIIGSYEKHIDFLAGKPNVFMIEILAVKYHLDSSNLLVVGDSYESDIQMAKNFNCLSVLVSKENKDRDDTIVVSDIAHIKNFFVD